MNALLALADLHVRALMRGHRLPTVLGSLAGFGLITAMIGGGAMAKGGAPGLVIFSAVVWVNFVVVCGAAIFFFPTAIVEELESARLPLLRLAGLDAMGIVFGKGGVLLLVATVMLLVQLPFAMLAITLGGITQSQVLAAFQLLGVWLLVAWSVSILISTFSRKSMTAAFGSLLALVVLLIWPTLISLLPNHPNYGAWTITGQLAGCFNVRWTGNPAPVAMGYLGIAIAALSIAICRVWWIMERGSVPGTAAVYRRRTPSSTVRPKLEPALVWKDRLLVTGGERFYTLRWLFGVLLALVVVSVYCFWGWNLWSGAFALMGLLLFIDGIITTARSFSLEIEEGSPDLLVLLPQRVEFVVDQKLNVIHQQVTLPWAASLLLTWFVVFGVSLFSTPEEIMTNGMVRGFFEVSVAALIGAWYVAVICSVAVSCTRNPGTGVVWGLARALLVFAATVLTSGITCVFGPVVLLVLTFVFHRAMRRSLNTAFSEAAVTEARGE
jgi:hypothetical protein